MVVLAGHTHLHTQTDIAGISRPLVQLRTKHFQTLCEKHLTSLWTMSTVMISSQLLRSSQSLFTRVVNMRYVFPNDPSLARVPVKLNKWALCRRSQLIGWISLLAVFFTRTFIKRSLALVFSHPKFTFVLTWSISGQSLTRQETSPASL